MSNLRPILDNVICTDGDFGEQVTESGVIVQSTIGKSEGITARWFRVHACGPDAKFVEPGDWIIVAYGRWTEHFLGGYFEEDMDDRTKMWMVEYESILGKSEDKVKPRTANIAGEDIVKAAQKTR